MPISEFWARGEGLFPGLGGYEASTKVMASAAHTCGKPVVGAEAFTSDRGWRDHPFLLKAMGDRKFCEGLNRMIFHLSAHQPYDNMVPGLTHRKWGEHFNRHNAWWDYSRPWMDYPSRCQYLLQRGEFVADVCYWPGEGAPLNVDDLKLIMPKGYDHDFCSSDVVLQMSVKEGRIVLPSGARYRYLRLPDTDRMTLPLARKIRALVDAGAARTGENALEISVVNLWINRLIGDEQHPLDGNWKDFETLLEWPDWFTTGKPRPSGRYTFPSCRHYTKDSPLVPSGLLGPIKLQTMSSLKGDP